MKIKGMIKLLTITLLAVCLAAAQTPSGLLTGPVTYSSDLMSGNLYGNYLFHKADGTVCSETAPNPVPANWSQCFIIRYVPNEFRNLQASDGTSTGFPNCYTWNISALILDDSYPLGNGCENSFHGGGSGEYRTEINCPTSVSSDINGTYTFNGSGCNFGGTAITVIGGVDTPITTTFTINATILHTPVVVLIPVFRGGIQHQTWQQITSMAVTVTPDPPASSSITTSGGGDDAGDE